MVNRNTLLAPTNFQTYAIIKKREENDDELTFPQTTTEEAVAESQAFSILLLLSELSSTHVGYEMTS